MCRHICGRRSRTTKRWLDEHARLIEEDEAALSEVETAEDSDAAAEAYHQAALGASRIPDDALDVAARASPPP